MNSPVYFAKKSEDAYNNFTICNSGVEVHVSLEDGWRTLAFRGTSFNFKEIIGNDVYRDARFIPSHDDILGWCHSGFLKSTWEIWPLLRAYVKTEEPVYLTGHSKGGAEATLVAALMVHFGWAPAGLITFGSPRVGFQQVSDMLLPVHTERYVHGIDMVPSHPWPLWGYRHVGERLHLPVREFEAKDRFLNHKIASYILAATETANMEHTFTQC